MLKIVSFLPAATQMIYDMGLDHMLYGVTFECPEPALAQKPKVVRCVLEDNHLSSAEIDTVFSAAKASGKSLYYVDEDLLQQIEPDIIFTQDVCEVCQIDTACTSAAIARLKKQPQLIALTPQTLQDVYQTAITIATALGNEEKGYQYLAQLQQITNTILDTLRQHQMPLKTVALLEWIQPIYNCGHWIPYQIAMAGGIDLLSHPGGDSIVTAWDKIVRYNPEIIVLAPCGFSIHRTRKEIHLLTTLPEWNTLKAVQNHQVYLANFNLFTQPSAGTLVNGIALLAALFHPQLFQVPATLQDTYLPLYPQTFAYATP